MTQVSQAMISLATTSFVYMLLMNRQREMKLVSAVVSLVPRPRPAFRRYSTASDEKLGGAWERG